MSTAHQNIRIKLKSFQSSFLDNSVKEIIDASIRTGAKVCGPIMIPTKKERYTVIRSPHVNKTSREQFEIITHSRVIDIKEPTPQTIDALMKLNIESGVEVEIKL